MKEFHHPQIGVDENGRLYDQHAREMLVPLVGVDLARRMEVFAALRWLMRRIPQHMERVSSVTGLSEPLIGILMVLKTRGDTPLGELADYIRVSARTITSFMDTLEQDRLVERVPDARDRRSVRAHLTEEGAQRVDRLWSQSTEQIAKLLGDFPQQDLDLVRHTCLHLVQNIDQQEREEHKVS